MFAIIISVGQYTESISPLSYLQVTDVSWCQYAGSTGCISQFWPHWCDPGYLQIFQWTLITCNPYLWAVDESMQPPDMHMMQQHILPQSLKVQQPLAWPWNSSPIHLEHISTSKLFSIYCVTAPICINIPLQEAEFSYWNEVQSIFVACSRRLRIPAVTAMSDLVLVEMWSNAPAASLCWLFEDIN